MGLDATERFNFAARPPAYDPGWQRMVPPTLLPSHRRSPETSAQQNKRLLFASRRDSVHIKPQRVAIWQKVELQPSC
jgi:hypothetical protein